MVYQFKDEWLDLVDENDQVIDCILRSDAMRQGLKNFRAVIGFLKNSNGQLWIPRRVKEKICFPLALDMSVAGHVGSGETYAEAFRREAAEEINFYGEYRLLGKVSPHKDGALCFEYIYEILSDDAPSYNSDDFCEAFWLYPQELLDMINQGERAKQDIPLLIKKFYLD
ncbi:TPA: NUDIX hydrolase [Candidatus Dependentiae bacterium]|nr:MAG: NUDIX hydrolase [candidate division TM6 bacterium GW2011_GWF2_36_131]KKQ03245.1 MAG: NUDIX hydrolase [candidate division TM6 bacterium GW2011_GWE2_36_25]KKQ19836.1 MAG: NUDIX hydrolase [candidate division TM6 bacterium GW2011_GWA2_36_9]HBR70326.1 NUDIX hydrolase [Candidatus Dependentiae bacterium]HCU00871.1 NUDIX hydrolase [Candidatus Dependentiae bacterium]